MERKATLLEAAVIGGAILLSSSPEATPLRAADSTPSENPYTLVTPLPETYGKLPNINSAVNSPEFQTSAENPGFILLNTYDQNDATAQDRLISDLAVQKTWIMSHGVPAEVFEQGIINMPLSSEKTNYIVPVNRLVVEFNGAKPGSLLIPYSETNGESKLAIYADPDGAGEDTKIDVLGLIPNANSTLTEPKALPTLFKKGADGKYVAISIFEVPTSTDSTIPEVPTVTGTPVYQAEVATDSLNLRDPLNPATVMSQIGRNANIMLISDRRITVPGKNYVLREALVDGSIALVAENLITISDVEPSHDNVTNGAGFTELHMNPVSEIAQTFVQEQILLDTQELTTFMQTENATLEDINAVQSAIQSGIASAQYISEEKWEGIDATKALQIFKPMINLTTNKNGDLQLTTIVQNSEQVTRSSDGHVFLAGSIFFVYSENENQVKVEGIDSQDGLNFGFVETTNGKSVLATIFNDDQGYIYKDVLVQNESGSLIFEQMANHLQNSTSHALPTVEFNSFTVQGSIKSDIIKQYAKTYEHYESSYKQLTSEELQGFTTGIEFVSEGKTYEVVSNIAGLTFEGVNADNFKTAFESLSLRNINESHIRIEVISNPNGEWLPAGQYVNENPMNVDASGKPLFLFESNPLRNGDYVTVRVHLQPQLLVDYNQTAIMKDGKTRTRNDYMFSRVVLGALITTNPNVTSAYNQVRHVAPVYPDIFDISLDS